MTTVEHATVDPSPSIPTSTNANDLVDSIVVPRSLPFSEGLSLNYDIPPIPTETSYVTTTTTTSTPSYGFSSMQGQKSSSIPSIHSRFLQQPQQYQPSPSSQQVTSSSVTDLNGNSAAVHSSMALSAVTLIDASTSEMNLESVENMSDHGMTPLSSKRQTFDSDSVTGGSAKVSSSTGSLSAEKSMDKAATAFDLWQRKKMDVVIW